MDKPKRRGTVLTDRAVNSARAACGGKLAVLACPPRPAYHYHMNDDVRTGNSTHLSAIHKAAAGAVARTAIGALHQDIGGTPIRTSPAFMQAAC